jgi:hypothetical protein
MYRTGVAAGHNGPTVFLLKGKNRKSGFNNTFLNQEGCELGSMISTLPRVTNIINGARLLLCTA